MPKQNKPLSFDKLRRIATAPGARVHFVGIGGVSMYSLARLTLEAGIDVSGSDRVIGDRVHDLVLHGATVHAGHDAANVKDASLVVYSHAIAEDNPELLYAAETGIPAVSRAEYMGAVMIEYRNRIGVSGSHGKSTTVAMLECIFSYAGTEPTVLSGSELPGGSPLKIASKNLMLYEACEYKDSFHKFSPTVAIGLNLELDHTDYFEDISDIKESFLKAMNKATESVIINADDTNLGRMLHQFTSPIVTFGQGESADYRYHITSFLDKGYEFVISRYGTRIGKFRLNIPGVYNVTNAVAAITCALEYGIRADIAAAAIARFKGIPRRLEYIGERFGRAIYYDYAHHPTEISAALNALKVYTHDLITVVFKPHTYSRTASLWQDFRHALSIADHVILTDIYPAREEPIPGVSSAGLAHDIGERAEYCADSDVASYLDANTHGTIVIMGAGDLEAVKVDILTT